VEKVYNFKYVDESELIKAAQAVVDAALLYKESRPELQMREAVNDYDRDALVDAVFEDPSLTAYLFQAGSPFEAE